MDPIQILIDEATKELRTELDQLKKKLFCKDPGKEGRWTLDQALLDHFSREIELFSAKKKLSAEDRRRLERSKELRDRIQNLG